MRLSEHPVLDFNFKDKKKVYFFYKGEKMYGYEGEPIAAALHDNGIKVLRKSSKYKRVRGLFCAIGKCSSCTMNVDGIPNVKTCRKILKEGMRVEPQNSKGNIPVIGDKI